MLKVGQCIRRLIYYLYDNMDHKQLLNFEEEKKNIAFKKASNLTHILISDSLYLFMSIFDTKIDLIRF